MLLPLPFTGAVMASWVVLWPLYLLYEVMRQSPVDEKDIQKDIVIAGWYRLYKRLSSNWQSIQGDMYVLWPLYLLNEVMRQSPVDEEDIQKDIVVAGWYRLYKRLSSTDRAYKETCYRFHVLRMGVLQGDVYRHCVYVEGC